MQSHWISVRKQSNHGEKKGYIYYAGSWDEIDNALCFHECRGSYHTAIKEN